MSKLGILGAQQVCPYASHKAHRVHFLVGSNPGKRSDSGCKAGKYSNGVSGNDFCTVQKHPDHSFVGEARFFYFSPSFAPGGGKGHQGDGAEMNGKDDITWKNGAFPVYLQSTQDDFCQSWDEALQACIACVYFSCLPSKSGANEVEALNS